MPSTVVYTTVPPELLDRARQRAERDGERGLNTSELLRLALAKLAGVDVAKYTPKMGRPPRRT